MFLLLIPHKNIKLERLLRNLLKKTKNRGPAKPLAFNKTNRQKGKAVIITKVNKEEVIKKLQLK